MITSDKIIITYGELLAKDCKIYELQQENSINRLYWKKLEQRIDKAIEYLKQYNLEDVKVDSKYFYEFIIEVLDILKGVEK